MTNEKHFRWSLVIAIVTREFIFAVIIVVPKKPQ